MGNRAQVTYRNLPPSPALSQRIEERANRLSDLFPKITHSHVLVEAPHRHHQKGRSYHVRIEVRAAGRQIVIGRDRSRHQAHEDVYVAVRDAFNAAERRLKEESNRLENYEPLVQLKRQPLNPSITA